MKRLLALFLVSCVVRLEAQTATAINENNLPSTSTLADTDSVRVIKGGQSMKTPASVVRTIRAEQINNATTLGRNLILTGNPAGISFPRINSNGTISYLNADAFLAAIGAGAASISIREIDGSPDIAFSVLEVPNDSLTDIGSGVARLAFGTGTGGGTWGTITGTLNDQTDLQIALDAKQPLDSDLTSIAALTTTTYGRAFLTLTDSSTALALLGAQASNSNLDDLADGSLTGSKVGTGINAANITSGTLALARGGLGVDASTFTAGLYGQVAGVTVDIDTPAEFSSALGVTGTPSAATVLRGDFTWGSSPGAITVREQDASPSVSDVTEIRVTNGGLIDNGGGSVSLDLSGGGGGGDTTSTVSSSVDNEIVLFSGTSGKQIKRATSTGLLTGTAGVIGTAATSSSIASLITDETGSAGSLVFSQSPSLTSPSIGDAAASSVVSAYFSSNSGDQADSGVFRLGNAQSVAWESSPTGTDMTLQVDVNEILTYNGQFSAVTLTEGGVAVPNASDNLSFFSSTTSAQFDSIISDGVGSGRVLFDTSPTLTTPTIAGTLTFNNSYAYADASMGALAIDTDELNNTKSVAVDSTFTFNATPSAGAIFGMQVSNTDVAPHTMTIPSSKSDARAGVSITSFIMAPSSTVYLKWRHEGAGAYTIWGEPYTINDLTLDAAPAFATDYVMIYSVGAASHKKVLLNALPTGSGDAVSVDSVSVVDPDFVSTGDIDFTASGSPATVVADVKANSVALTTDTTGNYQAETAAGLGIAVSGAAGEGFTKTVALDTTAALSGDHALNANEVKFGLSGIIFEGSTANTIEGYLSATDPTSSDRSWGLPDRSGTIVLSGDTFTGNVTGTLDPSGVTTLTITGNAVTGSKIAMGGDARGDILYYNGTDYAALLASTAGFVLQTGGAGADPSWVDSAISTQSLQNKDLTNATNTLPAEITVACSDENTALTTGTPKVTFRMPYAMTVTSVRASLTTAQTAGSLLTVDINDGGTTILSTKLTVDNNERTTTTAATPAVISDSALADDAEITVDIDTIGTSGATGLKVTILGTR